MFKNKRHCDKLARFDAEREELKNAKSQKVERKESEPFEKAESGGIKAEIYDPRAIDVELLEDLTKGKKTNRKNELIVTFIVLLAMIAAFICLLFGLQLPAICTVAGGVLFAIITAIPNFCPSKSEKKKKRGSSPKKTKDQPLRDKIKFKLKYDGKATAAKITAYENLSAKAKEKTPTIKCKIEYSYYDEYEVKRGGSYEGEIPPSLMETFITEGVLPVIFIKGTSRVLSHFPEKLNLKD